MNHDKSFWGINYMGKRRKVERGTSQIHFKKEEKSS